MRYAILSALAIMAAVDFFFSSQYFKSYRPKAKWTHCPARTICEATLCLLRKRLHLPHSNALPARSPGVYP